jgi:hypothetical protein
VRANSKLKANKQHIRFITDAIRYKMWTSGPDGVSTYYNKVLMECLREYDIEKSRVIALDAVYPEELEYVKSKWKNIVDRGKDMEMEHRLRCHDGFYR